MARYRIIRRPDPARLLDETYEVEAYLPYMDAEGNVVAYYWGFVASFESVHDAHAYAEQACAMTDNEVVREYN